MNDSELPSELSKPASYILHPTDFSDHSDAALAHALRLALNNHANLDLLHVGRHDDDQWDALPSIRQILQPGEGYPRHKRSAVTDLGIGIGKVIDVRRRGDDSIEGYCQRHPVDMIVLATSGRQGLASWIKPSTAERIAEKVSTISVPTLFVPAGCRGCVSIDRGEVSLDHVLVPVDRRPDSESAIERGLRAISMAGGDQASLRCCMVPSRGSQRSTFQTEPWKVERVVRRGNPAAEILSAAEACQANLIVMVTEGTHGMLDILRGTTTEQVLRQAPCPVLAVPAQD